MVREYQQVRDRDLVILLDLWLPPDPTDADRERVELAISFVATACVERMRSARECEVSLTVLGKKKQVWRGQAGGAAFDSLLELLALIEPGSSIPPAEILQDAHSEFGPTARKVILSTRKDVSDMMQDEELRMASWELHSAEWSVLNRFFDVDVAETHPGIDS